MTLTDDFGAVTAAVDEMNRNLRETIDRGLAPLNECGERIRAFVSELNADLGATFAALHRRIDAVGDEVAAVAAARMDGARTALDH